MYLVLHEIEFDFQVSILTVSNVKNKIVRKLQLEISLKIYEHIKHSVNECIDTYIQTYINEDHESLKKFKDKQIIIKTDNS